MDTSDEEIREQMRQHGDDGRAARETLFYFYGGDIRQLERLALSSGFEVCDTESPPGLILRKIMAVDAVSFEPVAAMMLQWASATGADYDGWQCQLLFTSH